MQQPAKTNSSLRPLQRLARNRPFQIFQKPRNAYHKKFRFYVNSLLVSRFAAAAASFFPHFTLPPLTSFLLFSTRAAVLSY
jgi:hypothetical protein